jgi:hypothetical protein
MHLLCRFWVPAILCSGITGLSSVTFAAPPSAAISPEERRAAEHDLQDLQSKLKSPRLAQGAAKAKPDLLADAEIFAKGVAWALRYDTDLQPADLALIKKALARGRERLAALHDGRHPWAARKGKLVRGYISAVDGSTQPFGLIVPAGYDPARPIRLDVVLHGSTRPVGMSELRFMNRFDEGDTGGQVSSDADFIELHPLGRVENCYRWAGETDVFEAIESVCRSYRIDRDRIVLRGMSMGASGTWHLGLKHPDVFVALGPYCGYVDTHQFSMTPLPNFPRVGPLPDYQEKTLHMLDSVDYAANAGIVPAIACMGEKDVFFQAHVIMGQAMKKEGLQIVNLISPGTGHVIDPVTFKEQMRRIGAYATKGLDHAPKHIRFVTWTLKYSRCHWLQVLGLRKHYARAELEARFKKGGDVQFEEPKNITRFAVGPPMLQRSSSVAAIGSKIIRIPDEKTDAPRTVVLGLKDGQWQYLGNQKGSDPLAFSRGLTPFDITGKHPGLQGPIEDAFTSSFLCVRGTGTPWNPAIQAWSEANLQRFAYEWNRYFRGDLPIKDDTAVTDDDLHRSNLILFGDPGSNRWIARVLPKLPIAWTPKELRVGTERYPSANHALALIYPNPLPGAEHRYVVLNSGHTFHEKELATLNYLLFPRLGDWAVFKVGSRLPMKPSEPLDETVLRAGLADEGWTVR